MANLHFGFDFQTALLSSIFVLVLGTFLKHLVVKKPLDNIPGPPSPSSFTISGSIGVIFYEYITHFSDR
jgi:hypothetical protein